MNIRLELEMVRQQVANLLVHFPELVEDDQLRADCIEGATDAYEVLRYIEAVRRNADAMAGGCATTIAELELRRDRFVRRGQAMRALAFKLMEAADLRKIEIPEATYSIRAGTPKVIVTDETALPDDLCRIKREPDKTKLKELLSTGQTVVGAELSNAEPSLSIRTK